MKKIITFVFIVALLTPATGFSQISNQLTDTLNGLLKHRAKLMNLKSVAASVVFPDGSIWEGAQGKVGTTPTSPNMLFEMGSNTKTFTASIILQLAHEQKLSLNDTIYKFLPIHPNIGFGITIRQLLNHTSGIYSYTEHPDFFDFVNDDENATIKIDSILKYWINPMVFSPGTSAQYSNTNYLLLGKIIELLDNKPYHEALRDRLLSPLSLNETFFSPVETYTLPKAGTWLSDGTYFGEEFKSFMSAAWAAGAIISTPSDLARWGWGLYRNDVLPGYWLDSMKQSYPVNANLSIGLGMFKRTYNGRVYLGHGGTTLQNSEMEYSTSSDFSVVTVINEQGKYNQIKSIQNAIINLVESLLPGVSAIEEKVEFQHRLYPNPATDKVMVSLDPALCNNNKLLTLKLYNLQGVLVADYQLNAHEQVINTQNLKKGIYLVLITTGEGKLLIRDKIVLH